MRGTQAIFKQTHGFINKQIIPKITSLKVIHFYNWAKFISGLSTIIEAIFIKTWSLQSTDIVTTIITESQNSDNRTSGTEWGSRRPPGFASQEPRLGLALWLWETPDLLPNVSSGEERSSTAVTVHSPQDSLDSAHSFIKATSPMKLNRTFHWQVCPAGNWNETSRHWG